MSLAGPTQSLLNAEQIKTAVDNLYSQLRDSIDDLSNLALVGVVAGGIPVARRLAARFSQDGHNIPVGHLDIALHRDDIGQKGEYITLRESRIPFQIKDKKIILIDDVIGSGRSARAAMDALMEFGRPKSVTLAVLIDRQNRQLPIHPDFVGMKVDVDISKELHISFVEVEGYDGAQIGPKS